MYCWATFCVGVFPPMGRVIWKARDTPGSWEVLHTSQAPTSCLLSTSVYQVKVANDHKMQYMFDVVWYEVNERKVKPVTRSQTQGLLAWAVSALTTELQPPDNH